MQFTRNQKVAAVLGAGAMAVAGSGVAFAYWTTTGSGTGSAGTNTAGVTNTLNFTTSTITAMYPGDVSQPFTVTVANTSTTQKVYVTNVKAYITTDKAGCTGADFLLNGVAAPSTSGTAVALGWTAKELDASGGTTPSGVTSGDAIRFNDTAANQDVCKSAVVTLNYLGT
jgi:hypothetical protein